MSDTKIAVVVVTYNGSTWISDCLRSLRGHNCEIQTVVVDNASTDSTVSVIERDFPEVHLIKLTKNVGFGVGNNVGISHALAWHADYFLLLNQDAYVLPGTLTQMAAFMDANPTYGICSPLHCSPDEHALDVKTFRTYLTRHASEYLSDLVMDRARDHYTIHGVNAAVWFIRTDTFARVGGFDPLFFMYGEDDDMLSRMAYHKVKFALLTKLRTVHQRQSPPARKNVILSHLRTNARRRYAHLVTTIKSPKNSLIFMLALLVSRGFMRPLTDLIVDRNGKQFVANWSAAIWVSFRMPAISRNARLTKQKGSHFLSARNSK